MSFSKTKAGAVAQEKIAAKRAQPLPLRRMQEALDRVYAYEERQAAKFRSSSLPYCPIIYARETMDRYVRGPQRDEVSWFKKFYTTIGTALHLMWQNTLAPDNDKARPFGSWKCRKTGMLLKDQFRPATLQKIGGKLVKCDWEYEEIEMEHEGLSCHIDFVEYYKKVDPRTLPRDHHESDLGDYWVIHDLKTAMREAVEKPEENIPVLKNVFQIETYMCIFELEFGIRPKYYALYYQTRDSHNKAHMHLVEWTDAKRRAAMKRLDDWARSHKLANEFIAKISPMLDRVNSDGSVIPAEKKYSPAQACMAFDPAVESRPCKTKDEYERIMAPCMTYENGCRHWKLCTQQSGQRLTLSLLEALKPVAEPREH